MLKLCHSACIQCVIYHAAIVNHKEIYSERIKLQAAAGGQNNDYRLRLKKLNRKVKNTTEFIQNLSCKRQLKDVLQRPKLNYLERVFLN